MVYYKRGKFKNRLKSVYLWCTGSSKISYKFRQGFVKTLIVRGIGYRVFALKNDIIGSASASLTFTDSTRPILTGVDLDEGQELAQACALELPASRYLSVRAGHTADLYIPLGAGIKCLTLKKDRKLTILSADKMLCTNLAKTVHSYRPPSIYTGRGVRLKHVRPVRKAGKKDKQKGRAF